MSFIFRRGHRPFLESGVLIHPDVLVVRMSANHHAHGHLDDGFVLLVHLANSRLRAASPGVTRLAARIALLIERVDLLVVGGAAASASASACRLKLPALQLGAVRPPPALIAATK